MRLLKFDSHDKLCLTKDLIQDVPSYAILSHTWGADEEEVNFQDLQDGLYTSKAGYDKIRFCGDQARKDRLSYFWVDTCCINKQSQAELTEAINSMFRWYQKAAKCYVYLADVTTCKRSHEETDVSWRAAFGRSRWFTRGWTLQELLAPQKVEFYSRDRKYLGDKVELQHAIHETTRIPLAAMRGADLTSFEIKERMRWAGKRETKRVEDKWYCLLGIFDVFMPPMYGEGDHAEVRLKDEIAKSCRRQLDTIAQAVQTPDSFSVPTTGNGPAPIDPKNTSMHDQRKEILASLGFNYMDSRRSTIKNAYSTTCRWLLSHPTYLEWMDFSKYEQHCGFLWINGKPGAGKSTLVKYTLANAIEEKPEDEILVSFFFNARGDELEKSTIGMYRALLFQILNKAPDLQEILDPFCLDTSLLIHCDTWTVESLCKLLSAAVAKLGQRTLKCFVDALDECDEQQVQEMIAFFEEIGRIAVENGNRLYTCFASRHYPTVDMRNGRQIVVEDEQGHSQDLAKYVKSHLRAGTGKNVDQIRKKVLEKANGVFMWVILVVPLLNEEFKNGRIFAVRKRLEEIPPKLSELFKHILRRDTDNMTDFLLCLQWILFAKRPLTPEEFYFAMVAGLDPVSENLIKWDQEIIPLEQINRFILSSSKGLAELTRSEAPTVQFIHESVPDFLVKDDGLCELWPELAGNLHSLSHDRLKHCCLNYLDVDVSDYVSTNLMLSKISRDFVNDLRRQLKTDFPFLKYASGYVFYHADEAAEEVPQDDFLVDFPRSTWIRITVLLERYNINRYTYDASLLYLCAERGLTRLIKTLLRDATTIDVRGERYHYPVFAALAKGHPDALRALLQHKESSLTGDLVADLPFGRAFAARKDQTPLLWALEEGHRPLARSLIICKRTDLCIRNGSGQGVIWLASEKGYDDLVLLLLEAGADINNNGPEFSSALYAASFRGHKQLVQILLEAGANSNAHSDYHEIALTALSAASHGGYKEIVQILIEAGADINDHTVYRGTALQGASSNGYKDIVQILLAAGADTNIQGGYYGTAIQAASFHGHKEIVQTLLEAGANVNTQVEKYGTALQVASASGHVELVRILVEAGADLNFRREDYEDASPILGKAEIDVKTQRGRVCALQAASANGHEQVVQILLEAGADISIQGGHYGTALQAASFCGRQEVVHILLKAGADVNVTCGYRGTALQAASGRGHKKIVQMLLMAGADANVYDGYHETALQAASSNGYREVTQMLIEAGADVNIQTSGIYRTALQAASGCGYKEIVQILIEAGAGVNMQTSGHFGTALKAALYYRHKEVACLLRQAGAH